MTVVYIDSVFLLNMGMDYLLLLLTAVLSGRPLQRLRFALCGGVGGLYAVLCFLPKLDWLWSGMGKLIMAMLLCVLAFGKRVWLRQTLLFLLVGAGMAGLTLAVSFFPMGDSLLAVATEHRDIGLGVLLVSTVCAVGLLKGIFVGGLRHTGRELLRVQLERSQHKTEVTLLQDTGNTLTDPLSGKILPVIAWEALLPLWSDKERLHFNTERLQHPESLLESLGGSGYRLLPYQSVGVAQGLLLLVKMDCIRVKGKRLENAWCAVSPTPLGDGSGYDGVWNTEDRI